MKLKVNFHRKNKCLSKYYFIFIFLFLCITIMGLVFFQTTVEIKESQKQLDEEMKFVCNNLNDRLATIDKLYFALEKEVDFDMKTALEKLDESYMKKGDLNLDLDSFLIGKPYLNLYVINDQFQIIKTTDMADLNLKFSKTNSFGQFLTSVYNEHKGYYSERINVSSVTSQIKKYSYYASGDNKYIFEAGYAMNHFDNELGNDAFDDLSSETIKENRNVMDVNIYNPVGKSFNGTKRTNLDNDEGRKAAFADAIQKKEIVKYSTKEGNNNVMYMYMPYQVKDSISDAGKFVIELKYTDQYIIADGKNKLFNQMLYILFCLLIVGAFHLYYTRQFLNPLSEMLIAFEKVENKDFSTRMRIYGNCEIKYASRVFNDMVESIENLMNENSKAQLKLRLENRKSERSYFETVKAFANSLDAKDGYTGGHCERVMKMTQLIAHHLNLSRVDIKNIMFGSILHDIGKIGIPDDVLKKPGHFSENEYEIMKKHPQIGYEILQNIMFLKNANEMVLFHHERMDGKGYPKGLKGEEIPYFARILAVTDAFDAMTSKRIYREKSLTVEEAFYELKKHSNTQFDSQIVNTFIDAYISYYGEELNRDAELIESKEYEPNHFF